MTQNGQAGVVTLTQVLTQYSGLIPTFGTTDFVIDPTNSGTVYLGTSSLGIWKTTNCGSSWVHINTGNYGTDVNGGGQFSGINARTVDANGRC